MMLRVSLSSRHWRKPVFFFLIKKSTLSSVAFECGIMSIITAMEERIRKKLCPSLWSILVKLMVPYHISWEPFIWVQSIFPPICWDFTISIKVKQKWLLRKCIRQVLHIVEHKRKWDNVSLRLTMYHLLVSNGSCVLNIFQAVKCELGSQDDWGSFYRCECNLDRINLLKLSFLHLFLTLADMMNPSSCNIGWYLFVVVVAKFNISFLQWVSPSDAWPIPGPRTGSKRFWQTESRTNHWLQEIEQAFWECRWSGLIMITLCDNLTI